MTLDEILPQLSGVRSTARGIMAKCPAHDDGNPSLSVKEGERGLLVKCWAGCTTAEIVAALGLKLADLFYDADQPRQARSRRPSNPHINRDRLSFSFRFHGDLLFLRATAVLDAAKNMDIAEWTDEQLDRALAAVVKAYHDLERANIFDEVACELRRKVLAKEADRYAV